MGKPFVVDISNLAGGLNEAADEMIADNELAFVENFYVDGPSLRQREGFAEIAGPYTEEILSIAQYAPSFSEDEITVLGCTSSLARVKDGGIVAMEDADGRIYPTSDERWWFEQYGDELFACRRGNGGVKRIYGASAMEGGIPAPTVAPNVSDGGAGKKTAGAYRVAVRYYNTITGARSNWSPLSKEITIADNHKLHLYDIPVSSSLQVNARQIGCTKPDEPVPFLVGQINDNSTTTYDENALSPDEYGEADVDPNGAVITDTRHGLPPDQAWALEVHKERLFVLNKDGLFWSEPGWMQSFKVTSFLPITNGTGLISWDQHGLVIACAGNAYILQGDTPNDWRIDLLSKEHGCPAGKSMAVGDGTLFWYTGVNIVASSGGAPAIIPRIERIRETLDAIPEADKSDVVGETIPSRGWYVLSVPTSEGRKLIVYDYIASTFTVFPDAPKTLARLLQADQSEAVLVAFDDSYTLYEYLTGATDNGTAVTATLKTKAFALESSAVDKIVRRVGVLCPRTNGTITIRVYHDSSLVATRAGVSLNSNGWKRIALNTSGTPGALVQIGLEYSGTVPLRLDQLQLEGVNLRRRVPVL